MNIRHRETFRSAQQNDALIPGAGMRLSACLHRAAGQSDLLIPDQRKQVASFCANKEWSLLAEYVEPGVSAMDDSRPEFQKMIERTTDDDRPFDVIVVHSQNLRQESVHWNPLIHSMAPACGASIS